MKKLCLSPSVFLQCGSRQYQDTSAPDYQGSDLFKLAPKSCHGLWAHITKERLLTSVALSGNDVLLFFSARLLTDCCKVQRQLVLAGSHFYSKTHCWLTHFAGSLDRQTFSVSCPVHKNNECVIFKRKNCLWSFVSPSSRVAQGAPMTASSLVKIEMCFYQVILMRLNQK